MNKDVKKTLRNLAQKGFISEEGGGRLTLVSPSGRRMAISQGGGTNYRAIEAWANQEGRDRSPHAGARQRARERTDVAGPPAATAHRRGSQKRLLECLRLFGEMMSEERVTLAKEVLAVLAADEIRGCQKARECLG